VWAVVTPPDYAAPTTSGDLEAPVVALPTIKLNNPAGGSRFEGTYENFTLSGEYRITFYARNGTGNVSISPPTILTVGSQTVTPTLAVTKSGTGLGMVTSAPAGITCGSDCTETYSTPASVTLTATADTGSTFTGWTTGGCTGTAPCTVTMDTARTINAGFALIGGSIIGRVSVNFLGHNDLGVKNATVSLQGTPYTTTPDIDGNFSLQNIPSGNYTLVISSPNIVTVTKSVSITGASVQVPLPAMTISVPASYVKGDANDNQKIGLEDAVYILQVLSGARQ